MQQNLPVRHTVEDVVQWILRQKGENVFKGWTEDAIRSRMLEAAQSGEMMIDTNNKGEIFGVVVFHKILYVEHILTSTRFSFRTLIMSLCNKFPGFKAQAHRNNKLVNYTKPMRLTQLTINLT